jgi:hypothetical protein
MVANHKRKTVAQSYCLHHQENNVKHSVFSSPTSPLLCIPPIVWPTRALLCRCLRAQFLAAGVSRGDLQSKNKAARGAFVSLLRTLCWRLRDDPSLVGVFLREGVVEACGR